MRKNNTVIILLLRNQFTSDRNKLRRGSYKLVETKKKNNLYL